MRHATTLVALAHDYRAPRDRIGEWLDRVIRPTPRGMLAHGDWSILIAGVDFRRGVVDLEALGLTVAYRIPGRDVYLLAPGWLASILRALRWYSEVRWALEVWFVARGVMRLAEGDYYANARFWWRGE